jgi:hypothetical protein
LQLQHILTDKAGNISAPGCGACPDGRDGKISFNQPTPKFVREWREAIARPLSEAKKQVDAFPFPDCPERFDRCASHIECS